MEKTNIKIGSNKSFGIVFSIVFLIIGLFPLLDSNNIRAWSLLVSLIFAILGLINSSILSPFNKAWFKFGLFLGKIVSPFVMGLIFFTVVTPTSLLMKLFNKDILNLKKNTKKSYWIEKSNKKSRMMDQF
ncbi:SxtJ family membrane protein [Candidatus Pelagibacter sp.]|nr:SxtJ family membrane protein [Candidatus Pelagibacter sp.]